MSELKEKKNLRLTDEVNGHTHTYEDSVESGLTGPPSNDLKGHQHEYEIEDDGSLTIFEKAGHIHQANMEEEKQETGVLVKSEITAKFEVKQFGEDDDEFLRFEGHASIFNNVDRGGDIILPGAFRNALAKEGGTIKLLMGHDTNQPIGLVDASEDAIGLAVKGRIPRGLRAAHDIELLLKMGKILDMSFGFSIKEFEIDSDRIKRISEIKELFEVSLVSIPMNPEATVDPTSVKSIDNISCMGDIEKILKEKGFTGSQRNKLISKIKSFSARRDVELVQRDVEEGLEEIITLQKLHQIQSIFQDIKGKQNGTNRSSSKAS